MTKESWFKLNKKGLKTVRAKTLIRLLPIMLATLAIVSGFSYVYSKGIILDLIQERMDVQLSEVSSQISAQLDKHSKLPEVVAQTIENQATTYSLKQYESILTKVMGTNEDTVGMGIYFEPGRYKAGTRFFSTYTLRANGQITPTDIYNDPAYNYPEQHWYKNGMKAKSITPPYFDPNINLTVATVTVPFFAEDKSLLGVVVGDLNLQTIQGYVSGAKVAAEGWATLYDGTGTYLAGPDSAKNNQHSEQATGAGEEGDGLGAKLTKEESGMVSYHENGDTYRVYHQKIPGAGWVIALTVPESKLFSKVQSLLLWVTVFSIIGTILAAAAVLLYSRMITGNLGKVNSLAKSLSQGNFTSHVTINGQDEFADMAGHLNRMTGHIRSLLENISETAHQAALASEELRTSSEDCTRVTENAVNSIQQVAAGSDSQMVSTQEAARAMEEMARGVQRIVDHSVAASKTTTELSAQAQHGEQQMKQAARFLQELERNASSLVKLIEGLNRHSGEIGNIAVLIAEISNQTNLLALNASIEAARAGEHGKGFAVVAQEVKKLAERSSEATVSISSLVKTIQQGNTDASGAMDDNRKQVGTGAALAAEAGRIFEEILGGLADITEQSHEISASSQELMAGAEQINSTVDQLAFIATETAGHAQTVAAASEEQLASMEQVAASSAGLSKLADGLQTQVSQFKVK